MVVLPVLFLLGSLFLCGHGDTHSTNIEVLKMAALKWEGPLECTKWDCNCTFYRQRGCCCAANEMFDLEEQTFTRISELWMNIAKLKYRVHELTEYRQIAFTASMEDSVVDPNTLCFGPFNYKVTVPYSNITLNDGNGYKPSIGVFTAPCDGVFVFSMTVYSSVQEDGSLYHKVQLIKNGEAVVGVWEQNREDYEDNANQVVVLEMQRGDQVYVELMAGRKLCTSSQTPHSIKNNILTGYVLYPHTYDDHDDDDY
ncbi:cerebellin 18 [Sebastes fasciatus]|uniref:cerebellin 18 n=1 Tax=Sebastes fasciatus TaxID=394691 RepID=UPI003D9F757A